MFSDYLVHILKTWCVGLIAAALGLSLMVATRSSADMTLLASLPLRVLAFLGMLPTALLAVAIFGSLLSLPLFVLGAALGWPLRQWAARRPVLAAFTASAIAATLTAAVSASTRHNHWAKTHPWPEKFTTIFFSADTFVYTFPVFFAGIYFCKRMPQSLLQPSQ